MVDFDKVMEKIINGENLSSFGFINNNICEQILRVVLYNMKSIINDSNANVNNINELYEDLIWQQ